MKRIAFLLCLGAYTAAAQQTDTTELEPVEVRALRAGATAPFAKTNLSKQQIQKGNLGYDLPFLLNQTPSVVVNSDAGNGVGYTGIRIRGVDGTRVNMTLNGIPYNDAESSMTFLVNLPDFASSVNSIQIQRGVGTSTNGAGAFGATINLSTNEVIKEAYASFNNSYGSFNTLKNTILAGTGLINGHFTADLRLSRITSDGYIDRATSNLRALYFSTAYLSKKSDLRLNFFTGKEKTYQAWNGVSQSDLATNRTINYAGMEKPGAPYDNETDNYRQDHYQAFFTHHFNAALTWNTALFYTRGLGYYENYKAGQEYADYGFSPVINGSDTAYETDLVRQRWLDNHFYGTTFSLQYNKAATNFILGGAISQYDGRHLGKVTWAEKGLPPYKPWYDFDADKKDANIYAKLQQQLGTHWLVFTDLQYRYVKHDINGFKDNPTLVTGGSFNFFNPKVGITYQSGSWITYASYAAANKEPNRDDFEANTVEIPRPEQLHDWELGIERKKKNHSFGLNFYYMKYRNQLVLTGKINDVGAYTRTNIPSSYRLGAELQGGAVINKWMRAVANLTLSRNRIENFTEYIDDYDNGTQKLNIYKETDISFSPAVTGAATITLTPVKALSIDLLSKYVGRQYLDNTSNNDRKLDPYFTQDLRAVYMINYKWLKQVDLTLQVNNVFNRLYEPNGYTFSYIYGGEQTTENYYFPMAGTNWMVGLNIKL